MTLGFAALIFMGIMYCGLANANAPVNQIDRPPLRTCPISGNNFIYGCGHICKPEK